MRCARPPAPWTNLLYRRNNRPYGPASGSKTMFGHRFAMWPSERRILPELIRRRSRRAEIFWLTACQLPAEGFRIRSLVERVILAVRRSDVEH